MQFRFPDVPASTRHWWLVITPENAEVCDADPGYPVEVSVTAALRRMVEMWRGDVTWPQALRSGTITIQGSRTLCRPPPRWLTLSTFASISRPAAAS